MKRLVYGLFLILLVACVNRAHIDDIHWLNGYWQIQKVVFPDNTEKAYDLGSTIDYISLEYGKGYRKKVQPSLDGTYNTSDDAIRFEVQQRHDDLYLVFSNGADSWEELLLDLDSTSFAVRNHEDIVYEYQRFSPLTLDNE